MREGKSMGIEKKLGVKWIPAILGAYIFSRAVAVFLFPEFGIKILSTDTQFGDIYGFKFSYIAGTLGLPIVFVLLNCEIPSGRLNNKIVYSIVSLHVISALLASYFMFIGNYGIQPCPASQGGPGMECKVLISKEIFYRTIIVALIAPVCGVVSGIWYRNGWSIFQAKS
jgi:hypothetical protein